MDATTWDEHERTHSRIDPLLLELEQQGRTEAVPSVERPVGRLLSVLVHAMQANRVLEIGTSYGYATLWMALALPPAGKIWTFDPDIERTDLARAYFQRAGVADRIETINQPALEVLPIFPQRNLDLVFVDANRREYAEYLRACVPLVKLSGLVVFHGLLLDLSQTRDFNETFLNHPNLDATIVPLGNGTGIGARK